MSPASYICHVLRNGADGSIRKYGLDMLPSFEMAYRVRNSSNFRLELPKMCHVQNLDPHELPFIDYRTLVTGWLVENES